MSTFGVIKSNSTQLKADTNDPTKIRINLPSYTTAQRDALSLPVTGEEIWNSDENRIQSYNGTAWHAGPVIDVFNRYRASGTTDTLAVRYATLGAAQAAYPLAGITSLDDTIDWAAFQQAVHENKGSGAVRTLELGDRVYHTGNNKTFGLRVTGDYGGDLHFRGSGRRGTRLSNPGNSTVPTFELHNDGTSGNLRGCIVDNIETWEGKHGFFFRRCAYDLVRGCSTFRPGSNDPNTGNSFFAIVAEICTSFWITEFLAQHAVTADFLYAQSSGLFLYDCNIGEDGGGVFQSGGTLIFNNCNGSEMVLRATPAPLFSTATGAICVQGGNFNWVGGSISLVSARTCVILADSADSISLVGVPISGALATESLIGTRRIPSNFRMRLTGIEASMGANTSLIRRYDTADPIRNTQIDNFQARVVGGLRSSIQCDDSLFDPQYNNQVGSILVVPT